MEKRLDCSRSDVIQKCDGSRFVVWGGTFPVLDEVGRGNNTVYPYGLFLIVHMCCCHSLGLALLRVVIGSYGCVYRRKNDD